MLKNRLGDERRRRVLRESEYALRTIKMACRRHGISERSFWHWWLLGSAKLDRAEVNRLEARGRSILRGMARDLTRPSAN